MKEEEREQEEQQPDVSLVLSAATAIVAKFRV